MNQFRLLLVAVSALSLIAIVDAIEQHKDWSVKIAAIVALTCSALMWVRRRKVSE